MSHIQAVSLAFLFPGQMIWQFTTFSLSSKMTEDDSYLLTIFLFGVPELRGSGVRSFDLVVNNFARGWHIKDERVANS